MHAAMEMHIHQRRTTHLYFLLFSSSSRDFGFAACHDLMDDGRMESGGMRHASFGRTIPTVGD